MKFYKQLIDEKAGSDKGEILKVASEIEEEMQKQGIHYSDDNFEKVADNHVVELSTRVVRGNMLKDADNPYDQTQITADSWEKANEVKYELAANALVDADSFIAKVFHIPVGKIFTSTSFFVIVYLLAWWANSNMGYNFNLDDLLYLYYIVIGKNVVTYGIDSVANSKRGSMPTKPTTNSAQQKI